MLSTPLQQIKDNGDGIVARVGFKGTVAEESIDVECKALYGEYAPHKGELPKNANYAMNGPLTSTA